MRITIHSSVTAGLFLLVALSLAWAGGSTESEGAAVPDEATPLAVVATTSIVGDVVRQVAGDAAEVTVLMEIGQNPHAWEPTPRAIGLMEDADILFLNGVGLEEGLLEIIDSIPTGQVVEVSEGIEIIGGDHDHDEDHGEANDHDHDHGEGDDHEEHEEHEEHDEDHHHAAGDPHVWFDPNNVIVWVDNIEGTLVATDPANAATYRANAERYREELRALDREIVEAVAAIPPERRQLVIDHVALSYFARRYGFENLGTVIPTVTDQAEPSPRDIAELVEAVRAEEISAIFVGGTASRGLRAMTEAVAAEVGRPVEVRELLTGSLTAAGGRGDTYLGFVRYNTRQIVEGLSN